MANCKGCGNIIPSGAKSCPFCGMEFVSSHMFQIGEIFDEKYEILNFLGAGGMGEIYKVKHIHLEDIRVIKIMRQSFAQEEQDLKRFLLEAKIATKLHHPNVAILYDFSQYKTGLFYMVWEYIPGFDISVVLRKCGKMPPGIAISFMSQALDGLGFIHKNGIIHRDISPENLMIYKDQLGEFKLKIIDLGIAKTTGLVDQHLTQTGMFLGKLKYCSPEQVGALEEGEKIDGRTDIYSIGLVLYEMLSGKSAIYSTTPYGYIHKHITQTPEPLSINELDEEANKKLNDVIFKALEKNRKNRIPTAEQFKEELLFLPIKEPELEEIKNYLKPVLSVEEKDLEERPTIITTPIPSKKVKFEEKATILEPEQKETIYTPPPAKKIEKEKEKEVIEKEKPLPFKSEKKFNLKPVIFGFLAVIFILILAFGLSKIKLHKKVESKVDEAVKIEKTEEKKEILPYQSEGFLKIHLLPYGKIKSLKNTKGENIDIKEIITPLYLSLPQGEYEAVVEIEPINKMVKVNFKIEPNKTTEIIKAAPKETYEKVLDNLF